MSFELMREVLACCRRTAAPPPERFVLLVLANSLNAKTGRCDPSIATLCAVTGYGRATVQRALAQLKHCGALTRRRRRRLPSCYVLHPTALEGSLWDFKGAVKKAHSGRKKAHSGTQEGSERALNQEGNQEENQEPLADAPAAHRRTAAHRVAKKSPRTDTPDHRIAVLLRLFCETHEAALGTKYLCTGARDAVAFKRALTTYDEATIRATLAAFFRDRTSRLRYGAKVTDFVDRIGTLAAAPGASTLAGDPRTAGNNEAIARGLGLRR